MSSEMKGRAVWGGVSGRSIGEQSSGGMAVKRKEARRGPARGRAKGVGAVPGRGVRWTAVDAMDSAIMIKSNVLGPTEFNRGDDNSS